MVKAKLNKFAFEVFKSIEDDEPVGGADDRDTAEKFAKAIGGVVREAVIPFVEGEMEVRTNSVWIDNGQLEATIIQSLDVYPTRNSPVSLGYVTVVIKPAKNPVENDEVKEHDSSN